MKNKKILFVQISNKLIHKNVNRYITEYYKEFSRIKSKNGFYLNPHYFEIPLWIPRICGFLPDNFIKELYICTKTKDAVNHIKEGDYDYVLFSVFDVNKEFISNIIENCIDMNFLKNYTGKIIVGGYTNLSITNSIIRYCSSLEKLANELGVTYYYNLDYSLFENQQTIPRLQLSTGCTNNCRFCTMIPDKVIPVDKSLIYEEVKAFSKLKFKLIYLDDKTFGQCANYKLLTELYHYIKRNISSEFEGFIVQTTVRQFVNKEFYKEFSSLYIKYVELGIETLDESLLKEYNKPLRVGEILDFGVNIKEYTLNNEIKLIPNFMIGFPNDNKAGRVITNSFITAYKQYFDSININVFADYNSTNLNDLSQTNLDKSYLTHTQQKELKQYHRELYKIATEIIQQ